MKLNNFIKRINELIFKNNNIHNYNSFKVTRKKSFFYSLTILGILLFITYSLIHFFVIINKPMALILLCSSVIYSINLVLYMIIKKIKLCSIIALFVCMGILSYGLYDGGLRNNAILWVFIFPLLTFFLMGKVRSSILIALFLLISSTIFLLQFFNIIITPYSNYYFLDIFTVFLVISIMTYFYEDTFVKTESAVITQLFTDSLTHMPNRIQLIKDIKNNSDHLLVLINVDGFKEVNDLYGNKLGDLVLIELSNRLKKLFEKEYIFKIYKLHADEFAVLMKNLKNKEKIKTIVKEIHNLVSTDFIIGHEEVTISVSLGIGEKSRDLLADTDMALKLAKESRRDYVFFEKSMKIVEKYRKDLKMLHQLKLGIATDNIIPFYQPIVNNKTHKIEKYECLVRLLNNTDIISPYFFLNIAKKAKLYPHITRMMMLKAFNFFNKYEYDFSINISIDDILNNDTVDFLREILKDYDVSNRLVFELIESEKIEERKEVSDFIYNMKENGCRIAIDDFGSGYSNFDYILRMNVDYIKIDASLIKNIDTNINSQIITETIVNFTKKLNIKTIAEYVHNKSVYDKVKELEIDYSQGYYLGKPESITYL